MNRIKLVIFSLFIYFNLSLSAQSMHTVVDVYDIFIMDWIPWDFTSIILEDGSEWRFDYATGRNIDIQINDTVEIFPIDAQEAVMINPRTESNYHFLKYSYPPEHEYWWNSFYPFL